MIAYLKDIQRKRKMAEYKNKKKNYQTLLHGTSPDTVVG